METVTDANDEIQKPVKNGSVKYPILGRLPFIRNSQHLNNCLDKPCITQNENSASNSKKLKNLNIREGKDVPSTLTQSSNKLNELRPWGGSEFSTHVSHSSTTDEDNFSSLSNSTCANLVASAAQRASRDWFTNKTVLDYPSHFTSTPMANTLDRKELTLSRWSLGRSTECLNRVPKFYRSISETCSNTKFLEEDSVMEKYRPRTKELEIYKENDEGEEERDSIYKKKYEQLRQELEVTKKRLQQEHEEEIENHLTAKKTLNKKLSEALENIEEERQISKQWRRKTTQIGQELQEVKILLQEEVARATELDKKVKKYYADFNTVYQQLEEEKYLKEKLMKEKDQVISKLSELQKDLLTAQTDVQMQAEKIKKLNKELDESSQNNHVDTELEQMKRTKQQLEWKIRDQQEEMEDMTSRMQLMEQAKVKQDKELEKLRQETEKEISAKEEELEEIKASATKRVKNLQAQLEDEQEVRHKLIKQNHILEDQLHELSEQPPQHDPEVEKKLRRDLKRVKALLRDAQTSNENESGVNNSRTLIRQLKNEVEDAELYKMAAIKAQQNVELELQEVQSQMEEVVRGKKEAEIRCLQLTREKASLHSHLEELEEELTEVIRKYKATVETMSNDRKNLNEQTLHISDLEAENRTLKEKVSELQNKISQLTSQAQDLQETKNLEITIQELESRLQLEDTTKKRLEKQVQKLEEEIGNQKEHHELLKNKANQAEETQRRLQRQIVEMRKENVSLQQKEAESTRRCCILENELEGAETSIAATKNDLRMAYQRIQDLQKTLQEDLESDSETGNESDPEKEPFEPRLSIFRRSTSLQGIRKEFPLTHLTHEDRLPSPDFYCPSISRLDDL
ncbi:unconventional myosin-XVIIIa-like [Tachypleus tridentatus]|uniref:unconventional myosin-XVIIIa-like n=1 Tax=Tachypleus tridentatus TaxID=6853 RepID=UPI003FD2146B